MQPLAALVFDVDGTLADTERDGHRVAFNRAFDEAGLGWHWDVARYGRLLRVTGGKERIRQYLSEDWPDRLREPGIDERIRALHAAKTRHYVAMLETGAIPLRPGVRRLLEEARAGGLRLAIATTTTPENVTALLKATLGGDGIGWFEVIAAGDVVPAKKPAPDIFHRALQALDLPPAACLAFEDSDNGVRAARGAGLPVIVTTNEYTRDQDFTGALVVLDGFGEPGAPATVLAGAAPVSPYVDVPSLLHWHRMAQGSA
ncbi:HAD-superfamily hydrolase, subfamily IA, variant 3 [Thioalkalivibrio nitratireducens DSM 14787]|uniref:HAD-superfamily hydrolase, subfamily IA, variant 3 n=1 Tax=Thioalkalivibrio nitratireducens (strain DSM 14787 / UNIQEM 213 / ALEN2) TaxID=1255043 RepID=L0E247_THIND|nr:HAD family hydrolase [Thioalkalivibrio nitratireducens]AGA34726.1 HAD-superfamily hydrolase, subfamily IA, variant 3 [Thioalkalivibrio nitratireducens DSM 14787]